MFNLQLDNQSQATVLIAKVMAALSTSAIFAFGLVAYLSGAWQLYVLTGFVALVTLASFAGWHQARRGRLNLGITLIIGALLLAYLSTSFLVKGFGFFIGVIVLMMAWSMITLGLESRWQRKAIGATVVITIIAILLDIFGLDGRVTARGLDIVVIAFGLIFGALFLYVQFLQFPNYTLPTKFVSATMILVVGGVLTTILISNPIVRGPLTAEVSTNIKGASESVGVAVGELLIREIESLAVLALDRVIIQATQSANISYPDDSATIQAELDLLDSQWANSSDQDALITARLNNPAATTLREFRDNFPLHAEIILTDEQGGLVAVTNRTSDYAQADEAWWQNAYADGRGSIHIEEPQYDESSDTLGIRISLPIYNERREIIGVMGTTYALSDLLDLFIVDDEQSGNIKFNLLLQNQLSNVQEGRLAFNEVSEADAAVIARLKASQAGVLQANFESVDSIVSLAPINTGGQIPALDGLGWNVIARQDEAEVFRAIELQQRTNILGGLIIALTGAAAAWYVGRLISKPILALTETANRIAGGDLNARVTVTTRDETGLLGHTFNAMANELKASSESLEAQVVERTRALEITTQISRRLSTILKQEQLIQEVVNQVQSALGYYHAHIYLWENDDRRVLRMVGGTGEAGKTMLANEHVIPAGSGLVGRAATTNSVVLVPDVTQDPDWLPNPLLPETKSEVAVPINIGGRVMGVLDVQHNVTNSLTMADAELLQSIASQVAVALENAKIYAQIQEEAKKEAYVNDIGERIVRTNTQQQALKTAVRELGQALGQNRTAVRLTQNNNNE